MSVETSIQIKGELRLNEPMAKHTSWRVGGPADKYYKPHGLADLAGFIQSLPTQEKIFWLGLGSNLLVRDGGVRGTVIALAGNLNELRLQDENVIYAEAGVSSAKLSRFAAKQGLSGLEFLSGIPGSTGGALAMNAGAFGSEVWSWVTKVTTLNRQGQLNTRYPEDYKISYRKVVPKYPGEWFVAAEFLLDKKPASAKIKELLNKRNSSQPIGLASCGSVFKNPQTTHAAKLIEQTGLKGYCINKACVSDKHANFIINTGDATAQDIEDLIKHIQAAVKKEYQILLEPEVKIIGEPL